MSWNQAWGLTPERTWPNAARELCWDQVDSAKQSGISDVGWKWEEEQAQWSGKELLQCAPASTDTQVCGSQRMSLFQIRSERMCLLRRAFAREAYSHTDKLRTLSENTLRHRLNFPTLESATREQRMIWYQSTLARPSHHTLYLATFFGFFEWENVPDLKLNGSLSHRALPALGQLADDLTRLLPCGLGFVWGWVPAILEQDLSGVSRFDSIPRAVPVPASVMVPVSSDPFFWSNLHQCSECKANFSTRVGMFLHKTKVSTIIVHFKGNTCPRCKSIFSSQSLRMIIIAATSSARLVRNRGARKRAMFFQDDQRQVRPRTEETWARSKRFLESLDSRLREIEGRNAAWLIPAGAQTVVAAVEQAANHYQSQNPGKGQTTSNGSAKSDISSWFAIRAFSNQSGQGGPAATSHHREAGQASCNREQAIDCRTEGHVGAAAQNVHYS